MAGSAGTGSTHDADVVVVGSGIACLTAAALLAVGGRRVVVCEQAGAPGGYAHAFQRGEHGEYTFDPAVHLIADQPMFERFLEVIGMPAACDFLPSEHFYRAVLPGFALDLPADREGFVEAHAAAFPHEADALRRFWSLCHTVHRQAHDMPPSVHLRDLDAAAAAAPELFRYRRATLAEVLDEHLTDERAKAVTGVCWQYLGVPPSRASFQTFAQLVTVHTDSLFAVGGGVQRLVDVIVAAIERHGGAVRTSTPVERILVSDGRARGVRLAGGEELRADVILSGADPFQTFEQLVGPEHVPPAYLRKVRRMVPSGSAFLLFAATTLDLSGFDLPHQVFTHRHWDHEANYRDTRTGDFGVRWITPTTLLDPTVAPEGEHAVVCKAITPYDIGVPWPERKEQCTQLLLDELDVLFPGFTAGLTFAESATPLTIERFSRNVGGAIHSWEQTPAQTEGKRPTAPTPVDGLYLCSQWTSIGGSFLRAFVSGTIVAQMVTAAAGDAGAVPDLRSDARPAPTA